MTVETATYLSQLNAGYPAASDQRSEGDDHLRLIKTVLQTQFPNLGAAAISATAAQLSFVTGVTSSIQDQLDAKALQLLSSTNITAVTAIEFANVLVTSGIYVVDIFHAIGGGGSPFSINTSASGTSWDVASGDYDWSKVTCSGTSATVTNGSTTATGINLSGSVETTTAWGGFCARVLIFNPAGTTHYKRILWSGTYPTNTTKGNIATVLGSGTRVATAAITGFRLYQGGTTMAANGKINLYKVL